MFLVDQFPRTAVLGGFGDAVIVLSEALRKILRVPGVTAAGNVTAALVGYFNRFHNGVLTLPERDAEIIAKFLNFPQGAPDIYGASSLAYDLARGLDVLRRQAANVWIH